MDIKKLKQTRVTGVNGVTLLISTIQYPTGGYETMVLNEATSMDLDVLEGGTIEQHQAKHKEWVNKYSVKKKKEIKNIPQRYKDFARDYVEVVRELQKTDLYKRVKDGGASNFDSPLVHLQGYREDILEKAIKEHSKVLGVSKNGRGWFVLRIPKTSSQGEHRTYQAKYIAKALAERGYTTSVDYRID